MCVGKLKTPGMRFLMDYYLKALSPWVNFTEHETQEMDEDAFLEKLEKFPKPSRIFLLDEKGTSWNTETWAKKLEQANLSGIKTIVFCIGGSYGFSEGIKNRFEKISLSPMTLSHELARVVLAEQLYRAWSILKNHPYHHQQPSLS